MHILALVSYQSQSFLHETTFFLCFWYKNFSKTPKDYFFNFFVDGENYFSSHTADNSALYILDIQLHKMDGIEVAKRMRARGYNGTILFLTSFREYVFDGYDVRALNYLLKPVSQEILDKCLDDVYQQLLGNSFVYRDTHNFVQIEYSDILSFSVNNHYVDITTTHGICTCRMTLSNILPLLPKDFVQCHRSYIVNMRHIRKIAATTITLSNKTTVQISRNHLDSVRHEYAMFSMRLDVPYKVNRTKQESPFR